jgi:hypothetical protein
MERQSGKIVKRGSDPVQRIFRNTLGILTAGLLAFGVVGYITSGEVGILILFIVIAVMTILVSLWGKRLLLPKDRKA